MKTTDKECPFNEDCRCVECRKNVFRDCFKDGGNIGIKVTGAMGWADTDKAADVRDALMLFQTLPEAFKLCVYDKGSPDSFMYIQEDERVVVQWEGCAPDVIEIRLNMDFQLLFYWKDILILRDALKANGDFFGSCSS